MDRDQNAAAKLEQIREGGSYVLMLARERLTACLEALDQGRFDVADTRCREALHKVAQLAAAENNLGTMAGNTRVVRACDVTEGMNVMNWGTVANIERDEHEHAGADEPHVVLTLHFAEANAEEVRVDADCELLVKVPKGEVSQEPQEAPPEVEIPDAPPPDLA